ncbi:MAG: flagellar biosynthesis regulator FlaF [Rhodomicrobium sp.]
MYQSSYSEVLESAPQTVRANERAAILHSIWLLEGAEKAGANSREALEALRFLRRLWEFFLIHVGGPESQLPEKLRADLISIGISLLKEADRIGRGESKDFSALKEISQVIADGLS